MSKQVERDYADKVDRQHLLDKPFNDPRVFREFAIVLDLFRQRVPGGKVLGLGCGPGWTSLLLGRAGFHVLGIDISQRMIEIARQRRDIDGASGVAFELADMELLDLERHDFDAALFFDCLHHCPAYQAVLQRTSAHLRPGGYVVLFETTWLHRISPHARQAVRKYGVTELGFTRRQLCRALAASGFPRATFYHDPGPCYRGLGGFLKAAARLSCDYWFVYPQAKNIVLAQKAESPAPK